jgi:prolyl-tRNA synthetase
MALIDKNKDFSGWYNQLVEMAKLSEHSSVKGCITILPYGYSIWEYMQRVLDAKIKELGALNMAFPLLIPYSYFEREKDHVDGFVPEVALVTSAGGKKLEEPLVVRPTSEVIIHEYFKNHIRSWRDLPLKVNQWCSVIRWEKRPRPFIRTTEFWWQEGHTAHATSLEASIQAWDAISMYRDFSQNYLAIPVVVGEKPLLERFAGAETTLTIEGMMQDGKAVQMGTSHILGKGFVEAVNISFQGSEMDTAFPTLTSWGVTTRLIGAMVMVHGDERGLVLPPFIAPFLIYIVPIWHKEEDKESVFAFVAQLKQYFSQYGITYYFDSRDHVKPGVKFYDAEIQGYPLRLDIGKRDIESGTLHFICRDTREKIPFAISLFQNIDCQDGLFFITNIKKAMHDRMFQKARDFRNKKIAYVQGLSEVDLSSENKFYITAWCQSDYSVIKEKQLTVRCVLPLEYDFEGQFGFVIDSRRIVSCCCVHGLSCQKDDRKIVIVAKCY